jgi:hypothetical protein
LSLQVAFLILGWGLLGTIIVHAFTASTPAGAGGNPVKKKRDFLKYFTAWFACLAAIGSIGAAIVSSYQCNVMKFQLGVMQSEQRPWIKPDLVIDGIFNSFRP